MSCIFQSSIGKKLIMSVSGILLVLFLLFHMSMNLVAAFSDGAYDAVCEFLGTNWYALAGTAVLAIGFLVHIVYAFILTVQNRRARGNDRYAVVDAPKGVEWSSQNMLVLGIIVLLGIALHLHQFWSHMMLAELRGCEFDGGEMGIIKPTEGARFIAYYFSQWPVALAYVVWIVAIWLHLTHGFWSMLQTLGWNNEIWLSRWKTVAVWYATIVCAGFAIVVLGYALHVFPLFPTAVAIATPGVPCM